MSTTELLLYLGLLLFLVLVLSCGTIALVFGIQATAIGYYRDLDEDNRNLEELERRSALKNNGNLFGPLDSSTKIVARSIEISRSVTHESFSIATFDPPTAIEINNTKVFPGTAQLNELPPPVATIPEAHTKSTQLETSSTQDSFTTKSSGQSSSSTVNSKTKPTDVHTAISTVDPDTVASTQLTSATDVKTSNSGRKIAGCDSVLSPILLPLSQCTRKMC
ncbi:hypothetical protein M3Y94_00788200 [Aphelenchoides besseyi]|nr:hypothetical protein M3Y94_00788200 [Aphelenchoides besseyi]KAI6232421.1 hypothetical protein M3Y95_00484100 [Aphelenchoides besseyi]